MICFDHHFKMKCEQILLGLGCLVFQMMQKELSIFACSGGCEVKILDESYILNDPTSS